MVTTGLPQCVGTTALPQLSSKDSKRRVLSSVARRLSSSSSSRRGVVAVGSAAEGGIVAVSWSSPRLTVRHLALLVARLYSDGV